MRVFVTLLLAVVYGMSCNAQSYEVKPQKAEVDDYIKLLNLAKYEVFSYDISSLCDSTRAFESESRVLCACIWLQLLVCRFCSVTLASAKNT